MGSSLKILVGVDVAEKKDADEMRKRLDGAKLYRHKGNPKEFEDEIGDDENFDCDDYFVGFPIHEMPNGEWESITAWNKTSDGVITPEMIHHIAKLPKGTILRVVHESYYDELK